MVWWWTPRSLRPTAMRKGTRRCGCCTPTWRAPDPQRWTVGGDKGHNTKDFVAGCRALTVTPHVTQHTTGRRSAIDERTTRHAGYALSQKVRKRVEEVFGWNTTVGGGRKLRYIGERRNEMWMLLTVSAYNLAGMANRAWRRREIPELSTKTGRTARPNLFPIVKRSALFELSVLSRARPARSSLPRCDHRLNPAPVTPRTF